MARILHRHPEVEITSVTGRSAAGQQLGEVFPHLSDLDLIVQPELDGSLDLVFSALPHKASAEAVLPLVQQGIKVVDISADFRLKQADEYEEWYGVQHPAPSYLEDAVYGLTELHHEEVASAQLVANPGCYPTSAILAMAPALGPALEQSIIEPDIVIDSKSGVSGAGRGLSMTTHFSEVNENVMAYSLNGHRHLPEITSGVGTAVRRAPRHHFFDPPDTDDPRYPQLLLRQAAPRRRLGRSRCQTAYMGPLQRLLRGQSLRPRGRKAPSNQADPRQQLLPHLPHGRPAHPPSHGHILLGHLVKGAAGQAVQNMNLMCGFPEETALEGLAVYP